VEQNRGRFASVYGVNHRTTGIMLPPEGTVTQLREEAKEAAIRSSRNSAIEHTLVSVIVLLIAAVFFAINWKLARRGPAAPPIYPDVSVASPQVAVAPRASEAVMKPASES